MKTILKRNPKEHRVFVSEICFAAFALLLFCYIFSPGQIFLAFFKAPWKSEVLSLSFFRLESPCNVAFGLPENIAAGVFWMLHWILGVNKQLVLSSGWKCSQISGQLYQCSDTAGEFKEHEHGGPVPSPSRVSLSPNTLPQARSLCFIVTPFQPFTQALKALLFFPGEGILS